MSGTTAGGGGFSVLEDPTGKRARWLRRAGRVVFLLFLVWLVAIVLGGLGLVPVAGIPLTQTFRPSQGPPPVTKPPKIQQPTAADLQPAVSAKAFDVQTAKAAAKHSAVAAGHAKKLVTTTPHGKSATAPGHTRTTTITTVTHGNSASAPGKTKTTTVVTSAHGNSTTAPGKTRTTTVSHGNTVAPGRTRKTTTTATVTTTTRGKSATAPGKTVTTIVTTTITTPTIDTHGKKAVAPGRTKTT